MSDPFDRDMDEAAVVAGLRLRLESGRRLDDAFTLDPAICDVHELGTPMKKRRPPEPVGPRAYVSPVSPNRPRPAEPSAPGKRRLKPPSGRVYYWGKTA